MAEIKALPADVASKIKSSIVISSLSVVVIRLLENALDAQAGKVDISVDFGRGSCTVEDDGYGIAPADFREDGGLGNIYHTSKLASDSHYYGYQGAFLASVVSLSIMTVVSHHRAYNSTNAVTFHHSRPVARLLPAPTYQGLMSRDHGTRVVVKDLFGNMPVRVKQRPYGDSEQSARDKEWRALCRAITGTLLGWGKVVTLTMRSPDKEHTLRIRNPNSNLEQSSTRAEKNSFDRPLIRNLLVHGASVDCFDWGSWITTSARTLSMTVQAMFTTEPAPTKGIQFISLGNRHISPDHGCNILYDEVNRLFAASSFGLREEEGQKNAGDSVRSKDCQSASNAPKNKQFRGGGKGTDRWPMFYIRIVLSKVQFQDQSRSDQGGKTELSNIIDVLQAMVTQFLTDNHFRPHKQRKRKHESPATTATDGPGESLEVNGGKPFRFKGDLRRTNSNSSRSLPPPDDLNSTTKFLLRKARPSRLEHKSDHFSGWGRIKAGAAAKGTAEKMSCVDSHRETSAVDDDDGPRSEANANSTACALLKPNALENAAGLMQWTNPVSKDRLLINARTGMVVDTGPRRRSVPENSFFSALYQDGKHAQQPRMTRVKPGGSMRSNPGSWADTLLKKWENPVFQETEEGIPQVSLHEASLKSTFDRSRCCHSEMDEAFEAAALSTDSRLTRGNLEEGIVIAQVDSKFILVRVEVDGTGKNASYSPNVLLILIDQHAADERIRVEGLLADLCNMPANLIESESAPPGVNTVVLSKPILFELQCQETNIFKQIRTHFANWGIIYDMSERGNSSTESTVKVTALPPAIAERCRIDPKHLIEMMRGEAWRREETRGPPPNNKATFPRESERSETTWVQRIHDCPRGILDMINSRACRSSIMFNDPLSMEECTTLVRKLAGCRFPFQCAHGRPSMIPLVNLAGLEDAVIGTNLLGDAAARTDNFIGCWTRWKGPEDGNHGPI